MKPVLLSLAIALLMVGCGEDIKVPKMIACDGCGKKVSSKGEDCPNCGHPIADSVAVYKKAQELARIRADEKQTQEEEEERRLFAKREKEKVISVARKLGLDDHTIILNAVDKYEMGDNYTGWAKETYDGQILALGQFKDGKRHGLTTRWYENGQKREEVNYKDHKKDGLGTEWYGNGQKRQEVNYKDYKHMSAEVWKPNGEKCTKTNLKDGNGFWVWYRQNGTGSDRWTLKDGKRVFD